MASLFSFGSSLCCKPGLLLLRDEGRVWKMVLQQEERKERVYKILCLCVRLCVFLCPRLHDSLSKCNPFTQHCCVDAPHFSFLTSRPPSFKFTPPSLLSGRGLKWPPRCR